ncbi:MAG: aminodeoxychorismate synthase component I [Sulfurimonas sp.]|jgi:para-aminobenzoate synthetase component 1|nr:aminodeoxychorismate synthase component I [Sulfurimonadaceae bacterium]
MPFSKANLLGQKREPFLIIADFLATKVEIFTLDELRDIEFSFDEFYTYKKHNHKLEKSPIDFSAYEQKLNQVQDEIKKGNTYLLNLTQATPIKTNLTLKEIYSLANAKFKLRFYDEFVVFSPERFVNIKDNTINTYPMKGTMDASIKDAKKLLLEDEKELAEHTMVVDLLRNDLSMVANRVEVKKFRYIDEIDSGDKKLLQVSSHISGIVGKNWQENIGDILKKLLPAGSISGTPKQKTLEIIDSVEGYDRGYFSGVFGFFDGESFDSAVMIRFIEKTKNGYLYKSGGGITIDSKAKSEYNELLDKIYIP